MRGGAPAARRHVLQHARAVVRGPGPAALGARPTHVRRARHELGRLEGRPLVRSPLLPGRVLGRHDRAPLRRPGLLRGLALRPLRERRRRRVRRVQPRPQEEDGRPPPDAEAQSGELGRQEAQGAHGQAGEDGAVHGAWRRVRRGGLESVRRGREARRRTGGSKAEHGPQSAHADLAWVFTSCRLAGSGNRQWKCVEVCQKLWRGLGVAWGVGAAAAEDDPDNRGIARAGSRTSATHYEHAQPRGGPTRHSRR